MLGGQNSKGFEDSFGGDGRVLIPWNQGIDWGARRSIVEAVPAWCALAHCEHPFVQKGTLHPSKVRQGGDIEQEAYAEATDDGDLGTANYEPKNSAVKLRETGATDRP